MKREMTKRAVLALVAFVACACIASAQEFKASEMWNAYNDKADGGSSVIEKTSEIVKIGDRDVLSVTVKGSVTTQFQYGFCGLAASADPATLKALREGSGISFQTKGDGGKYRIRVETSDITDFNMFGKEFTAPKGKPVEIVIPFKSVAQEPWGIKKKFDPSKITKISFHTIGQPIPSYELTVIDLKVVP